MKITNMYAPMLSRRGTRVITNRNDLIAKLLLKSIANKFNHIQKLKPSLALTISSPLLSEQCKNIKNNATNILKRIYELVEALVETKKTQTISDHTASHIKSTNRMSIHAS